MIGVAILLFYLFGCIISLASFVGFIITVVFNENAKQFIGMLDAEELLAISIKDLTGYAILVTLLSWFGFWIVLTKK